MITKAIGKNTVGQGERMNVKMKTYELSTHNLSKTLRTTMATGTLVPMYKLLVLPGDKINIKVDSSVLTHPTVGPLFGSYKFQIDFFKAPMRLYQSMLQNNELGMGLKMDEITFPQLELQAQLPSVFPQQYIDSNSQVNPSSILSYLGIRGIGTAVANNTPLEVSRRFNATSWLMYWDVYKNFYANKQEKVGYVIHTDRPDITKTVMTVKATWETGTGGGDVTIPHYPSEISYIPVGLGYITINCGSGPNVRIEDMVLIVNGIPYNPMQLFQKVETIGNDIYLTLPTALMTGVTLNSWAYIDQTAQTPVPPKIEIFDLPKLDEMRRAILSEDEGIIINENSIEPYGWALEMNNDGLASITQSQEGLAIKTYQSDLFNNWINTEWVNSINTQTAIDTSGGSFTMDMINMATKLYDLQNRIALSGGTIDDWIETVYTAGKTRTVTTPEFIGGMSREIEFQEVVASAATSSENGATPLGQLAGRGVTRGHVNGGYIECYVDEPAYILGIASITPRVDYSQGNDWDTNLKSMDDLHKPALDGIGFQDLISDQFDWRDTKLTAVTGLPVFQTVGKQPAWINYTTDYNQTKGNFAIDDNEMFMTLNRRYTWYNGQTVDKTTYIDPVKYNYIFAETSIDAMNFWVQCGFHVTGRRKMSARQIPNL